MIATDIKPIRQRLGLTQAAFAAALNRIDPNLRVHAFSVSRWESGGVKTLSPHAAAAVRILDTRSNEPDAPATLRLSEHLQLAAAGFEEQGSAELARLMRTLAANHRASGNDPTQVTDAGERLH